MSRRVSAEQIRCLLANELPGFEVTILSDQDVPPAVTLCVSNGRHHFWVNIKRNPHPGETALREWATEAAQSIREEVWAFYEQLAQTNKPQPEPTRTRKPRKGQPEGQLSLL